MADDTRPRGASVHRPDRRAVYDLIEAAPEGASVVGLAEGDVAVAAEFDVFPHVLAGLVSGGGR